MERETLTDDDLRDLYGALEAHLAVLSLANWPGRGRHSTGLASALRYRVHRRKLEELRDKLGRSLGMPIRR